MPGSDGPTAAPVCNLLTGAIDWPAASLSDCAITWGMASVLSSRANDSPNLLKGAFISGHRFVTRSM